MSKPESPPDQSTLLSRNPSNIMPHKLDLDSNLKFSCHPGVACFTACCGNINIVLTPYDILRIRRALNLPAAEFLLRFTTPVYLEKTDLPGVRINLDEDGRCPFVTEQGCTIYEHRPTTCRYYPVGMSYFRESPESKEESAPAEEFYFLVKEDHCKGHEEEKVQTIREWRGDQGIDESDVMNKEWMELVMRRKSFGLQATLSEPAKRIFFMASTDLDKFRELVLSDSFLSSYELDEETQKKLREDDVELMLFSFRFLAATIFGIRDSGLKVREERLKQKVEQIKKNRAEKEQRAEETYQELLKDHEELKQRVESKKSGKGPGQ
ncbi:YkgJ family cysteine cluster protein [Desulfurivibrio dismutans]|uniref:YkgJ family cysteine cluster protein n=1 Tax=Desulfurivibrio dismutans TaxID=1398908 RepID=UPI0023DAFB35|nr:YkgJ family cysteine cluster protein [Desulfurivibrio alkaliphilus]MDF1613437.1 YkgJ family cysteine cluster protein [Desulfurivibrio alkaliphilus]